MPRLCGGSAGRGCYLGRWAMGGVALVQHSGEVCDINMGVSENRVYSQ